MIIELVSKCSDIDLLVYLVFETEMSTKVCYQLSQPWIYNTFKIVFSKAPVWLSDTAFYFKLPLKITSVLSLWDGNSQPGVVGVGHWKHFETTWGTFSDNTVPPELFVFFEVSNTTFIWASSLWWQKYNSSLCIIDVIYMKSSVFICIIAGSSICNVLFKNLVFNKY